MSHDVDDVADMGARFADLGEPAERRLRRSFVAALGREAGLAATSAAVAYGREHRERLGTMDRPVAQLYRFGRAQVEGPEPGPTFRPVPDELAHEIEPRLPVALGALSELHRAALTMADLGGWTSEEAAEALGITVSSLDLQRAEGLERLRAELGPTSEPEIDPTRQLVDYLDATTEPVAPPAVDTDREASAPEIVLLGVEEDDDDLEPTTMSPRRRLLVGAAVAAVAVAVGVFVADDGSERGREAVRAPSA